MNIVICVSDSQPALLILQIISVQTVSVFIHLNIFYFKQMSRLLIQQNTECVYMSSRQVSAGLSSQFLHLLPPEKLRLLADQYLISG